MALTQRLEFRQSQSLVMTPQLMQAIKLLQLSNLDLTTFVEEELERNPLLERANDEAPAGEATAEAGQFSDNDDFGGSHSDEPGGGPGEAFEPGQEEWMRSLPIPTFAAFTLARNSASSLFLSFVKACTSCQD